jgi:hypothetical protein
MSSGNENESEPEAGPHQHEQDSDGEQDEDDAEECKKPKKQENVPREWMEVERWSRSDHSDTDIEAFIRCHLDASNRGAGIVHPIPGAHKLRNNIYGDFQFRRKWATNKGQVMNFRSWRATARHFSHLRTSGT